MFEGNTRAVPLVTPSNFTRAELQLFKEDEDILDDKYIIKQSFNFFFSKKYTYAPILTNFVGLLTVLVLCHRRGCMFSNEVLRQSDSRVVWTWR